MTRFSYIKSIFLICLPLFIPESGLEAQMPQNNTRMFLDYVSSPKVIDIKDVSSKGFQLNIPFFEDSGWMKTPQRLLRQEAPQTPDSLLDSPFAMMYLPTGAKKFVFSAPDKGGSWNIYQMDRINDTLWSTPKLAGENLVSAGNEIFPIMSASGTELYFCSNGYSGLGGYDLFVSEWDQQEKEWGIPQNLGIPYSSPSDDFIYMTNGSYTQAALASNRCDKDGEIRIYILDIEDLPMKRSVSEAEAASLYDMQIENNGGNSQQKAGASAEQLDYNKAVASVRSIQDSIRVANEQIEKSRDTYIALTTSDPAGAKAVAVKIGELESTLSQLQGRESAAVQSMQAMELDFLTKGIFVVQPSENELGQSAKSGKSIDWSVKNEGTWPNLNFEDMVPESDMDFKVAEQTTEIFTVDDMPSSLVFQLQLCVVSSKLQLTRFKGLTPVFERKSSAGKYVYSAGVFKSYKDALSNISAVKRCGFTSAIVVAFQDKKPIALKTARAIENKKNANALFIVEIQGYETLPQVVLDAVKATTTKEISKSTEGGISLYTIGLFNTEKEAQTLATSISSVSDKKIEVKRVEK